MSRLRGGESVASFEGSLVSRSIPIDPPSFQAVLQAAPAPRTVWAAPDDTDTESTENDRDPTVIGSGAAVVLRADGPARFERIRSQADALVTDADTDTAWPARPRLFGGFAFHDDHDPTPPWTGFSGAQFVLPRIQITWKDDTAWLTTNAIGDSPALETRIERAHRWVESLSATGPTADPPGIHHRERLTDRATWRTAVTRSIDRIRAGELRKVVLAQALRATVDGKLSTADTLCRLRESYPDCFGFLVDATEGRHFLGATPERLVSLRGQSIHTGALAGTIGRGNTPEEDERLARELQESEKNAHEHDLVVNAIREQLAPFTRQITTDDRRVRRFATVQHLETPMSAKLAREEHVLSLVEALHPTPAVGGLPPDRALTTIRTTEPFDRGWYAAPVGWFDTEGNGSFAVALRSAVATQDVATLFAGVGIVSDSDPDDEWDEVQLKYRPVLDALQ
ncbi:isochorismate synthase [Halocatena pleomorpha]|uniref:isochorismate synthase n=1 Tax=Halocatena pleomorpha TaxID=1785090 RepID=A0A3P3RC43_9EURY|nr:isochorismate synthase [Halocatena pleomorpha]RRJ30270.1 isochorismate synthase [Halocatena pleomorpha]